MKNYSDGIINKSVVKLEKLRDLFNETKYLTNNFKNINDDLLLEKTKKKYSPSSRLLILRLGLRMNRKKFMKLMGITRQTLSAYEAGVVRLRDLKTSIKYINKIRKKLNRLIKWDDVLLGYKAWLIELENSLKLAGKKAGNLTKERYGIKHFKEIAKIGARNGGLAILNKYGKEFYRKNVLKGGSKGGKKGGITMARISPLTEQEKLFLNKLQTKGYTCFWKLLDKVKIFENRIEKDISFDDFQNFNLGKKYCEIRPEIKLDKKYVPDFLMYNKNLKIIVECTRNVQDNMNTYLKSVKLVNRAIIFRKKYKNFVVVVSDTTPINPVLHLINSVPVVFEKDIDKFLDIVETSYSIKKIRPLYKNHLSKRESSKRLKPVSYSMKIPRTTQEKKIYKFLHKNKFNFQFGYPISNKFGSKHFVDFVIFNQDKPKVIIEVTHIDKLRYRNIILGSLRLWKTIHSSKNYYLKNVNYIGIISHSKFSLDNYNEVHKIGSICDNLILNDDLGKLKKVLNNNLTKSRNSISNEEVVKIWSKFKG